jgi:hypothetical protein
MSALLAAHLYDNNLQKTIDLAATRLTDTPKVIAGIAALSKMTDNYVKENLLSRLAGALNLKPLLRTLFYPVRAFTTEERIAYLEQEAARCASVVK